AALPGRVEGRRDPPLLTRHSQPAFLFRCIPVNERRFGSGPEGQAAEAFGVADAGGAAALLGPLAEELPEPLPRFHQLALVAEQGVDLRFDVGADVDPA